MKKIIPIFAIFLLAFSTSGYGQSQYQKGDVLVNAGLSIGVYGYGYGLYGSSSGFLPINLSAEYSINEMFSAGPYVGIYSRAYKYLTYKDRFTALSFGGRGTFHASGLLNEHLDMSINEEKLDVYASVFLGIESRSWKSDSAYAGDRYYTNSTKLDFGTIVGLRYLFNPTYSAFLELGQGSYGIGTLGISAKF